ncbi:MAG: phospholipase A2 [Bdellovibrionota bacterium]|jgi:hypothetical protein|nr:phospholipase A2 [Bdellovibrionota bacterium]
MKEVALFVLLCSQLGGRVEQGFKCPKTWFRSPGKVCYFENSYGEELFTDGCTGPTGGFKDLFLSSCVKHDLCYHHEPATNGLTRKECDDQFEKDLLESCEMSDKKKRCQRWAKTMVSAVRPFGGLAYRCEDKAVRDYSLPL